MRILDTGMAEIALEAARTKAREIGLAEAVAIVDPAGALIGYARYGRHAVVARDAAVQKALTAAVLGFETGTISYEFGVELASTVNGAVSNLAGGLPIIRDGILLGAIGAGCGGTAEQDVAVAEAGRTAILALFQEHGES